MTRAVARAAARPTPTTFQFRVNSGEERQTRKTIEYLLTELRRWDRYCRQPDSVLELSTINHEKKNNWKQILQNLNRLERLGKDKEVPLTRLLSTVRAWPEVVSCGPIHRPGGHSAIQITFLPVTIGDHCTSLIQLFIGDDGYVGGGNITISHPHIRQNDICQGYAQTAFMMARHDQNLLAMLTIARQYVQGWNPRSELNDQWKYQAAEWWQTNAYGAKEPFLGWDTHSILNTDDGKVVLVEKYYGQAQKTIISNWMADAEHNDDDDEDECRDHYHCERCNSCCDDDYVRCAGTNCDDVFCGMACIARHSENQHGTFECEGLDSNWDHDEGPTFTDRKCDDCNKYICEECSETHAEEQHPKDEDEENVLILTSTAPLPGQAPLIPNEDIVQTAHAPTIIPIAGLFTVHYPNGRTVVESNEVLGDVTARRAAGHTFEEDAPARAREEVPLVDPTLNNIPF